MKPDNALIEKFNSGTCTPEEVKAVMGWLLENEEDSDTASLWEHTSWKGVYDHDTEMEMLSAIRRATFGKQAKVRQLRWRQLTAAASIFLVAGAALCWYTLRSGSAKVNSEALASLKQETKAAWTIYRAPHDQERYFRLPDGTQVRLLPDAALRFDAAAYNVSERALKLDGIASFDVAVSAGKPFSVSAGGFTTVALGTKFMMAAADDKEVRVRLYSGKVLVRKTAEQHVYAMNDVYLTPGDEWKYHIETHKYMLSHADRHKIRPQQLPSSVTIQVHEDSIVFENAPLHEVLDFLQHQYQVTIDYQQKDVKDVYFSGKMLSGDALKMVLDNITRVNELTLTASDGVFIIR